MDKKHICRRSLLKAAGLGAVGGSLYSLDVFSGKSDAPPPSKEAMTLHTNPRNGDTVSALGFGCMRLPMLSEATSPMGTEIDEDAFFDMVDYALAQGVNYFDTAYGYHSRASQVMVGKALKRHPRESFFLATKMPGYLSPSLAEAKDIFLEQLEHCQVEYFDYYLLHNMS